MATTTAELPGTKGPEKLPSFIPTPNRIAQYLELKQSEVEAQLASVEGRKQLRGQLKSVEDQIKQDHPDFDSNVLDAQLDEVSTTLRQNSRFLEEVKSPEKKGIFRRAWETVKGFPRNHPVVTTILGLAAAAGAVAGGFYLTGNWELLMSSVGLDKILGGAEAAGELVPPTPGTPPLPDGGVFEVPLPPSPPDIGNPV